MRKVIAACAAFTLLGSLVLVGSAHATANSSPSGATVNIVGTDRFLPNSTQSTYRFPAAATRVASGGTITFVNQTGDGHAPAVIDPTYLPKSFNCQACNALIGTATGVFFTDPTANLPAGLSVQAGAIDDTIDVSTTVASWPLFWSGPTAGGVPQIDGGNADMPTFSQPTTFDQTGSPSVGDAVIVAPGRNSGNNGGGPDTVTVQVNAPAGTTLHYVCLFHIWMQGTIQVV